jgi:hypothetical protein
VTSVARKRLIVAAAWIWIAVVVTGYLVQFQSIIEQLIHRLLMVA